VAAPASAQQTGRIRRIGILFGGFNESDPEVLARVKVFRLELEQLGWVEGRNIRFDLRAGAGDTDRIHSYAEELIGMMPDVLAANAAPAFAEFTRTAEKLASSFHLKYVPAPVSNLADVGRAIDAAGQESNRA
jgi:putative tryptophan/tyrosine transport system substrate-binding protein